MTDEEVDALMPAVEEFIEVVRVRNLDGVEACVHNTSPRVIATVLADLLWQSRAREKANNSGQLKRALKEALEANQFLRKKLVQEQNRVEELREIMKGRAA